MGGGRPLPGGDGPPPAPPLVEQLEDEGVGVPGVRGQRSAGVRVELRWGQRSGLGGGGQGGVRVSVWLRGQVLGSEVRVKGQVCQG